LRVQAACFDGQHGRRDTQAADPRSLGFGKSPSFSFDPLDSLVEIHRALEVGQELLVPQCLAGLLSEGTGIMQAADLIEESLLHHGADARVDARVDFLGWPQEQHEQCVGAPIDIPLLLNLADGLAGGLKNLQRADHASAIVRMDACGSQCIGLLELRVEFGVFEFSQGISDGFVGGWALEEPVEEGFDVEVCAARDDRDAVSRTYVVDECCGLVEPVADGKWLVGVSDIYEVVGEALALQRCGCCGADVHAPVDLHGVCRDNLDGAFGIVGEELGQTDRERGLAPSGGPDDDGELLHAKSVDAGTWYGRTSMIVPQSTQEKSVSKRSIQDVEVAGLRVLMRVDFNVPIEDGVIQDDRRIRLALPSIKSVLERGGRLVLLSHRGRPGGIGFQEEFSLEVCAQKLGELLGAEVGFPSQDCLNNDAQDAVAALADGRCVLLENLRFHKGEKKNEQEFAQRLASYGDVYCNEAFGTSHRNHASMLGVPASMEGKPRVMGLLLEQEVRYLSEAMCQPEQPFVAVLGGAKVSDKISCIEYLIPKAAHILIGGAMSYTFMEAMDKGIGDSRVEAGQLSDARQLLEQATASSCELHLPKDHICSREFSDSTGGAEVFVDEIPDGWMGLDIGPKTQGLYEGILHEAKTIVWNGPMGVFEWPAFKVGTQQMAKAMAAATTNRGATTIIGGGDTASAAERFGVADAVSHVSTGGGASLAMLSGKPFETIEILDDR
jgi:phosphoglycerate kinase